MNNINRLPGTIIPTDTDFRLKISREFDGRWCVSYSTDFGYLRNIRAYGQSVDPKEWQNTLKHNKCDFSDDNIDVVVDRCIKWLEENGYSDQLL